MNSIPTTDVTRALLVVAAQWPPGTEQSDALLAATLPNLPKADRDAWLFAVQTTANIHGIDSGRTLFCATRAALLNRSAA